MNKLQLYISSVTREAVVITKLIFSYKVLTFILAYLVMAETYSRNLFMAPAPSVVEWFTTTFTLSEVSILTHKLNLKLDINFHSQEK